MKLTQAEWKLMNALWQGHPATARDISERLGDEVSWAYTTVKTMLTRLARKGALRETKKANVGLYEPLLSRRKARLAAVRSVAQEAFDGAFGTLMHFLIDEERLSPAERKEIAEMLDEESRKGAGDD